MSAWEEKNNELNFVLKNIHVLDGNKKSVMIDEAFQTCCQLLSDLRKNKKTCFFIGNGASASMASHFSADFAKNGKLRTQTFTDLSIITAIGNDISYDEVFSQPINWYSGKDDILVAISSSGNSLNVVNGIKAAKENNCKVITLSAMGKNNRIFSMGDINFYIPAKTYGLAETGHSAILHHCMDLVEAQVT